MPKGTCSKTALQPVRPLEEHSSTRCTLACGGHVIGVCLQVPQLGGLTALEILYLRGNRMPNRKGVKRLRGEDGLILFPKMAVTESSLRWMLQCRYLQHVRSHSILMTSREIAIGLACRNARPLLGSLSCSVCWPSGVTLQDVQCSGRVVPEMSLMTFALLAKQS